MTHDSEEYIEKKRFFSNILTVYGRKPVLEAISDPNIDCYKLHLADSNKPAVILNDILQFAEHKNIEVAYYSKKNLSRISKNAKQDQGIALDIKTEGFIQCDEFLSNHNKPFELIALDGITNPQNLGMIIRSVCASPMTGILLPDKGCATLDSLVIKASAGTLFKARMLRCKTLVEGLKTCSKYGATIYGLDANAPATSKTLTGKNSKVFVLGNETKGVSQDVRKLCNHTISIPMNNKVESLNVAVTASLLAFRNVI